MGKEIEIVNHSLCCYAQKYFLCSYKQFLSFSCFITSVWIFLLLWCYYIYTSTDAQSLAKCQHSGVQACDWLHTVFFTFTPLHQHPCKSKVHNCHFSIRCVIDIFKPVWTVIKVSFLMLLISSWGKLLKLSSFTFWSFFITPRIS